MNIKKSRSSIKCNAITACQKVKYMTLEDVFDKIAALEREGMLTHMEAFDIAERYANIKPGQVVVPAELYNSLSDNGC